MAEEEVNSIQEPDAQEKRAVFAAIANACKHFLQNLKQKKALLYGVVGGGLFFLLVVVLMIMLFASKNDKANDEEGQVKTYTPEEVEDILHKPLPSASAEEQDSSVDNLIIKGNILYDQGYRQEAYEMFRKVANFSQSIANYNLGTMELKSNLYNEAIAAYNDSIQTGQNVAVSAINAAVASLKIHRFDLYSHYLNIASENLSDILNEPFYSYAYALSSYYNDRYFETLSPLINPNTQDFSTHNHRLAAHVFSIFGDDKHALEHLQAAKNPADNKSIGLLYARQGEYELAQSYLSSYIREHPNDIESLMAIQLINLKRGNFATSAKMLRDITARPTLLQQAIKTYPITLVLNPTLFDVSASQESFWKRDASRGSETAAWILFYFAPYRIFDMKQALGDIDHANRLLVLNLDEGKNILLSSSVAAKIDKDIIRTLVAVDSKDLRQGLAYLLHATANNPNHATLYYNLALVYAQLGQFDNAYTYFLRAYYLDQNDVLSGVFAAILGKLNNVNTDSLVAEVSRKFYEAGGGREEIGQLIRYLNDARVENEEWKERENKPFYLAISLIDAINARDVTLMKRYAIKLKEAYPHDIVSNIVAALISKVGQNLQDISIDMYKLFQSNTLDLRPLYRGWAFPRTLYVYMGFATGSLQNQARIMQNHLVAQQEDPRGLLQTLALIHIYQKEFEKAYAMYNTLIDEFNEKDARTMFFAAVAAVGAGRKEDAGLLLQLAKLETATIYEARYALGLLYQEAGNYKAAEAAYSFIQQASFQSDFFDFQIDAQKIYAYELESNKQQSSTSTQ